MEIKLELMCDGVLYKEITEELLRNKKQSMLYSKERAVVTKEEENEEKVDEESDSATCYEIKEEGMEEDDETLSYETFLQELDAKICTDTNEMVDTFRRVGKKLSIEEWEKILGNPVRNISAKLVYWMIYSETEIRKNLFYSFSADIQKLIYSECENALERSDFERMTEEYMLQFFKAHNEMKYGYSSL